MISNLDRKTEPPHLSTQGFGLSVVLLDLCDLLFGFVVERTSYLGKTLLWILRWALVQNVSEEFSYDLLLFRSLTGCIR